MINVVHVLSSLIRATKVELLNGMEINKWYSGQKNDFNSAKLTDKLPQV